MGIRVPRNSEEWLGRFWTRPLVCTPKFYGSENLANILANVETNVAFQDDVPSDVNGFRIDQIRILSGVNVAGVRFRIYDSAQVRDPGATQNIPQINEAVLGVCSGEVSAFDVAWLIEAGLRVDRDDGLVLLRGGNVRSA